MSKPVSSTAVGAFVIGALILIVVAVLLFSSGSLFTRTYTAVAVFPGNVKGLTVGAPVEMRGVKIGSVKEIDILLDRKSKSVTVPVYLEIMRNSLKDLEFMDLSADMLSQEEWAVEVGALIEAGLKAQLGLKSLVTGQLIVEVDFLPDTPINLTHVDTRYPEIPTVETITDRLINQLQELSLQELVEKAILLMEHADQLLSSQEVKDTLVNIRLATQDAHKLLTNVDSQVEPLSDSAKSTLSDISSLARNVDGQVRPVSDSAIAALIEAKNALNSIDDLVGKDSATRADLENALNELSKAANSIRTLTDYLEQHPEALIKGKGY